MNRESFNKPNAECAICGKKYYRCAKCIQLKRSGVEAWKLYCDTFECFSVRCLLENAKKGNFDSNALDELMGIELADGRELLPSVKEEIETLKELYGAYNAKQNAEKKRVQPKKVAVGLNDSF